MFFQFQAVLQGKEYDRLFAAVFFPALYQLPAHSFAAV